MAFKVLCVVFFICLIDSLHSASVQRIKRNDNEETTTAASTDTKGSEASTKKPGLPDMNTFTKFMPQMIQVTDVTNKITQNNQASSLIPDIKSCVPSGIPGGEQETTKEPEKSTSVTSDNSGSQDSSKNPSLAASTLQFTKVFDKVSSQKGFTNFKVSEIPIIGSKE